MIALLALSLLVMLQACSPPVRSPIETRQAPPSQRINVHEVQSGETLYSIAWRYEADFRDMAVINGLADPYMLRIGQRLKIFDDGQRLQSSAVIRDNSTNLSKPAKSTIGERTRVENSSNSAGVVVERSSRVAASATKPKVLVPKDAEFVQSWAWPISGRIVKSFGADRQAKGLLIDPGQETWVAAAAKGEVVYAGTGIRGIGNLIILKHSDLYLSAYAHNKQLFVREGDTVTLGQKIAVVGNDASGSPSVYFEIREDGRPVDPIRFLPKR